MIDFFEIYIRWQIESGSVASKMKIQWLRLSNIYTLQYITNIGTQIYAKHVWSVRWAHVSIDLLHNWSIKLGHCFKTFLISFTQSEDTANYKQWFIHFMCDWCTTEIYDIQPNYDQNHEIMLVSKYQRGVGMI